MQVNGQTGVGESRGWRNGKTRLIGRRQIGRLRACRKPPRWPTACVAAVEALWGNGYAMPGGGQETMRLVKPLALSPSVTLLLLGGGMGDPACIISAGLRAVAHA